MHNRRKNGMRRVRKIRAVSGGRRGIKHLDCLVISVLLPYVDGLFHAR